MEYQNVTWGMVIVNISSSYALCVLSGIPRGPSLSGKRMASTDSTEAMPWNLSLCSQNWSRMDHLEQPKWWGQLLPDYSLRITDLALKFEALQNFRNLSLLEHKIIQRPLFSCHFIFNVCINRKPVRLSEKVVCSICFFKGHSTISNWTSGSRRRLWSPGKEGLLARIPVTLLQ